MQYPTSAMAFTVVFLVWPAALPETLLSTKIVAVAELPIVM